MTVTTLPYDVAATLRTPEEMAAYLEACIEKADGEAAFIVNALGNIARAQGMTEIARQTGLSLESSRWRSKTIKRSRSGTCLNPLRQQLNT